MRTYKISVGGHSFEVKSDAPEERLQALAEEVENRFRSLKKSNARSDQDFMIMSMVAVSLLEELNQTRQKCDHVFESTREFTHRLMDHIDELLVRDVD
jgi:cell division protein ZapA (FtsZ GTPase activity inhibitor)